MLLEQKVTDLQLDVLIFYVLNLPSKFPFWAPTLGSKIEFKTWKQVTQQKVKISAEVR